MPRLSWIPSWLGGFYSLLYREFRGNTFTVREVMGCVGGLGYSYSAVKKALSELVGHGWATREGRGRYRLRDPRLIAVNVGLRLVAVRVAERLKSIGGVHAVILVGSVADGRARGTSDVDLVVVVEKAGREGAENVLYSCPHCGDSPLVISPEDLVDELGRGNPNVISYLRAGFCLYDDGLVSRLRGKEWEFSLNYVRDWVDSAAFYYNYARKRPRLDYCLRALKSAVYADLALHKLPLRSFEESLEAFSSLHPKLVGDVDSLSEDIERMDEEKLGALHDLTGKIVKEVRKEWERERGKRILRTE